MHVYQISRFFAITALATIFSTQAEAQLFARKHARKTERAPKAILVQLPTFENRMQYLQQQGNDEKQAQLKRDADSVQAKMIADFSDNLTYCPIYFYYDRDADKIRQQQFSGVLLNSDLQPVTSVLTPKDTNYFIAMFGIAVEQPDRSRAEGSASAGQNVLNSDKQRLQILDHRFYNLSKPMPDGSNNATGKSKRPIDTYRYESPVFNIYYQPYVANYNARLHIFYGKYPYKK